MVSIRVRKNRILIIDKDYTDEKYLISDVILSFGSNIVHIITENEVFTVKLKNNYNYNIIVYPRLKNIKLIISNEKGRTESSKIFKYDKEKEEKTLYFTVKNDIENGPLTPYNYHLSYDNDLFIFGCEISIKNDDLIIFEAKTSYGHSMTELLEFGTLCKLTIVKGKYLKLNNTYLSLKEF